MGDIIINIKNYNFYKNDEQVDKYIQFEQKALKKMINDIFKKRANQSGVV